jgi:IS30 family transposase
VSNRPLARQVASKLRQRWSPQQIAGWLRRTYPHDQNRHVSHETIYRSLFIQARGALKKELLQHLRRKRTIRRARHKSLKGEGLGQTGHWEGDLIFGTHNSQIATLVERHTRYVLLAKIKGKDTETVINALIRQALIRQAHKLPQELYKSLTWDRGSEMADHRRFTLATGIQVYFCDPQSPWQRGSNENTNAFLRQYFPKGTDLLVHSQAKLNAVARQLNERPGKTVDYETPAERFAACVASTG